MFRQGRVKRFRPSGHILARSLADFVVGSVKKAIKIKPSRRHRPKTHVRGYARLAREAYQGNERSKAITMKRHGAPVYKYAPEYSTENEAVYFTENEAVVSLRGTANASDVVTDINLGLGQLAQTNRAKSTRAHFKNLLDSGAFGDRRIVVVGHSLGGSLTNMLGEEFDGVISETHAFNPGGSLRARGGNVFSRKRKRPVERQTKAYEHYIEADPIGAMARHQSNNIVEIYDQLDPDMSVHTINNFF